MDPKFTIPYPEFFVADKLRQEFPKKNGYSVYIPLSRQEKGVDLILVRRFKNKNKLVTIQVKASRTYENSVKKSKASKEKLQFDTWFKTFKVDDNPADFFFFFILYATDPVRKTKKSLSVWETVILVFSKEEMKRFINSVKGGSFYFSFDSDEKILCSRGNKSNFNYADYFLSKRIKDIEEELVENG